MAKRFLCRECRETGSKGAFHRTGKRCCPNCGSKRVIVKPNWIDNDGEAKPIDESSLPISRVFTPSEITLRINHPQQEQ